MTTFFLPSLFGLTCLVGIILIFNGLRGLVRRVLYVPDFKKDSRGTVRTVEGGGTRFWGMVCLAAGVLFVLVGFAGFQRVYEFQNSPAFLRYMVPAPDGYEILYSMAANGGYEIAYTYPSNAADVRQRFLDRLREEGWTIATDTPFSVVAQRGEHCLTLSFVGWSGEERRSFQAKVIVSYSTNPDS
ncbi:MAG: hypothetical protein C4523_05770 [Myxococcales bacterium]|nr:MAG: hypothetical protein C4523_05770 [Myxococcales bacterium]